MTKVLSRKTALSFGLLLCLLAIVGCGGNGGGGGGGTATPTPTVTPQPMQERIEDFIGDLRSMDGVQGTVVRGLPPADSGGPTIVAPVAATVPDGTTQALTITSSLEIDTLNLVIDGADGYWVLDFGAAGGGGGAGSDGTSVDLLVTFAPEPPRDNFDCLFSAGDANGAVGGEAVTSITIDTCTVEEFCADPQLCNPPEAQSCLGLCPLVQGGAVPACALAINAAAACDAVSACLDSATTCEEAGDCAESATDGIVDAACATDTCVAVDAF